MARQHLVSGAGQRQPVPAKIIDIHLAVRQQEILRHIDEMNARVAFRIFLDEFVCARHAVPARGAHGLRRNRNEEDRRPDPVLAQCLQQLHEILQHIFRTAAMYISQIVRAHDDDDGGRIVRRGDARCVMGDMRNLRTAETAIDGDIGRHVALKRRPAAKAAPAEKENGVLRRRIGHVTPLESSDLGFPIGRIARGEQHMDEETEKGEKEEKKASAKNDDQAIHGTLFSPSPKRAGRVTAPPRLRMRTVSATAPARSCPSPCGRPCRSAPRQLPRTCRSSRHGGAACPP